MNTGKRFTAVFTTIIFLICTFVNVPFSFAEDEEQGTYIPRSVKRLEQMAKQEKENKSEKNSTKSKSEKNSTDTKKKSDDDSEKKTNTDGKTAEKDTSWFDYSKPRKQYTISNEAELLGFASLVNEKQDDGWKPNRVENFENTTFILTSDIKLTNEWSPVANGISTHFAGVFDGNGHTISNMKIISDSGLCGFFGELEGEVKNLTVKGTVSSSDAQCGSIAGRLTASGIIDGCIADVKVTALEMTGGIAGFNDNGTIRNCRNLNSVTGTYKAGGICGENYGGVIYRCINSGIITSSKRGVATYGTGGIAGRSVSGKASIEESCNLGKIRSDTEATGGIAGYMNAKGSSIKNCYNSGTVLILQNESEKDVSKANAGGIVGTAGTRGVIIKNSYNSAGVFGADVTGGIAGKYLNDTEEESEDEILNNYYISGFFDSGIGFVEASDTHFLSDAVKGVSAKNMIGLSSSISPSFRKGSVKYGNGGYPVFRWQEPLNEKDADQIIINERLRKKLDKYNEVQNSVTHGKYILDFLNPQTMIDDALMLYIEKYK